MLVLPPAHAGGERPGAEGTNQALDLTEPGSTGVGHVQVTQCSQPGAGLWRAPDLDDRDITSTKFAQLLLAAGVFYANTVGVDPRA